MSRTRGKTGSFQEVDSQFGAARVSMRPPQLGNLGAYQVGVITGTMAAGIAGDSEVLQFTWMDSTRLALITKVSLMSFSVFTTAFTAGIGHFSLQAKRSITAVGSGGAAPTLTTNNAKLRTDMGTTLISGSSGDLRVATTAALTAATGTLDAAFLGRISIPLEATTVNYSRISSENALFDYRDNNYHPFICESGEGLAVLVTMPATGTWYAGFKICWQEVTSANWPNGS